LLGENKLLSLTGSNGGKAWRLTILEPTATPMLRFILSFTATVTADTCSAKNKIKIL
jgi:hypothetical protein